jgi:mannose-6-phosphate isomerase-like protein (cupin superfamily)
MRARIGLLFCIVTSTIAGLSLSAADPPGFEHWTSEQLNTLEGVLADRLKAGQSGNEALGTFTNHSALIVRRESSGRPEMHMRHADVFIVQTGEAVLRVGGQLVEARELRADEMTGSSISGGVDKTLTAGDIVHIPARTSHQIIIGPGQQMTYVTLKIEAE